MRSAVLRRGQLLVRDDVPDPEPQQGQVLVEVKACGICGSDLHFAEHGHEMLALGQEMKGRPDLGIEPPNLDNDIFMGHEFSAEVLEAGPDTQAPAAGSVVTSMPIMMSPSHIGDLAYSDKLPAGYSERMLLAAPLLLEVPNGLTAEHAALTEPMAVGLHAVNKSNIARGEGALVLGCGPVGLACIAALKLRGIDTIVAADFSPARRELAQAMGAHVVVDPSQETAYEAWTREGGPKPLVTFEAIGVPGIIDDILRDAPAQSRIVVVGVCMQPDQITPFFGISKELNIQFVLGYDPMEFAESLRSIAEGDIEVGPMITGQVDLDAVPRAFEDLGNPDQHCKILVVPGSGT